MKKAVIVVGSHHAGKSKTIRLHLKPLLGIEKHEHKFSLKGKRGFVLSQSREEAAWMEGIVLSQSLEESGKFKRVAAIVRRYSGFDLLVMAARPSNEKRSCLKQLVSKLKSAGFRVNIVNVIAGQAERFYKESAGQIHGYLTA
jgi:hypothetical protein